MNVDKCFSICSTDSTILGFGFCFLDFDLLISYKYSLFNITSSIYIFAPKKNS